MFPCMASRNANRPVSLPQGGSSNVHFRGCLSEQLAQKTSFPLIKQLQRKKEKKTKQTKKTKKNKNKNKKNKQTKKNTHTKTKSKQTKNKRQTNKKQKQKEWLCAQIADFTHRSCRPEVLKKPVVLNRMVVKDIRQYYPFKTCKTVRSLSLTMGMGFYW